MSKAEDRANEKYPLMKEDDKDGLESLKYVGMECDSIHEFNSIRCAQQGYFIEGYKQAEKDLALTWDDMMIIHKCIKDAMNSHLYEWFTDEGQQRIYQNVLDRFNKERNRKTI